MGRLRSSEEDLDRAIDAQIIALAEADFEAGITDPGYLPGSIAFRMWNEVRERKLREPRAPVQLKLFEEDSL